MRRGSVTALAAAPAWHGCPARSGLEKLSASRANSAPSLSAFAKDAS